MGKSTQSPAVRLPGMLFLLGGRFLVGCSCGNLAFPNVFAAESRHNPCGIAGVLRFEAESKGWPSIHVLACQVCSAARLYPTSVSAKTW
jgi:hypothetical protein